MDAIANEDGPQIIRPRVDAAAPFMQVPEVPSPKHARV
jgi:hypothetical protein